MREHEVNSFDNFIAGWYLDDPIIDELINYHKETPDKSPGVIGGYNDATPFIDLKIKNSMDVCLFHNVKLYEKYVLFLQQFTEEYKKKYSYCDFYDPWNPATEPPNIQYYPPGGGFFQWHCERGSSIYPANNRHLVYMTYLNDVTDAGETEFFYQKVKIKPERGLTIIWPADWCFTHRGVASPTQEKYIITGWYHYVPRS